MHDKFNAASLLGPRPDEDGADECAVSEMEIIAGELIDAVHAKDVMGVEEALRAAFACLDAEPHYEGPHED